MNLSRCAGVLLLALLVNGTSAQTVEQLEADPALKPLGVTTSWIGNTWGYGNGKYVQNNVQHLWVKPDGTAYTGSGWDEGHFAGGIYKGGDRLGTLQDTFQDFAGVASLSGDERYIYAARNNGTIRRYRFDGGHDPFPGGGGQYKDEVAPPGVTKEPPITALAADAKRHRLYATAGGTMHVYDIGDGIKSLPKQVAPQNVRALAIADDGTLWAATARTGDTGGEVVHLAAGGHLLPTKLTAGNGFDPVALCLDKGGRIWVADGGEDQNVKVFAPDGTLSRTFGEKGGVFAGPVPGRVGLLRFCGITGVGLDAAGNVYVGQNRVGPHATGYAVSGGILESYK